MTRATYNDTPDTVEIKFHSTVPMRETVYPCDSI